jgi:hypothetical protein
VAVAALALSGCSDTNFSAQTSQQYQAAEGANVTGEVDVLNTLLVANPDGSGTVSASLVNHQDSDDAVTGISARTLSDSPSTLPVKAPTADVSLPVDDLVRLGTDDAQTVYTVGSAPEGLYVELTVSFETAADVVIEAPVVARSEMYDGIATG